MKPSCADHLIEIGHSQEGGGDMLAVQKRILKSLTPGATSGRKNMTYR